MPCGSESPHLMLGSHLAGERKQALSTWSFTKEVKEVPQALSAGWRLACVPPLSPEHCVKSLGAQPWAGGDTQAPGPGPAW